MTDRSASRTAVGVATLRAAHQLVDDAPRILEDPVAVKLLDASTLHVIRTDPDRFRTPRSRGLRAHVVLRSRYAEDRLEQAAGRNVTQYVLLGAGLDTFAYRQPAWARGLRIFEVDHPASQSVELPENLVFVGVDFEVDVLCDALVRAGFDVGRAAFFSWLGVTMYLVEEAIDAVLRFVVSLPWASEIVFTFAATEPAAGATEAPNPFAARAAALGEPWRTRFDPRVLVQKLRGLGFSDVSLLVPSEAEDRYFRGRVDGLYAPRGARIASARV